MHCSQEGSRYGPSAYFDDESCVVRWMETHYIEMRLSEAERSVVLLGGSDCLLQL